MPLNSYLSTLNPEYFMLEIFICWPLISVHMHDVFTQANMAQHLNTHGNILGVVQEMVINLNASEIF